MKEVYRIKTAEGEDQWIVYDLDENLNRIYPCVGVWSKLKNAKATLIGKFDSGLRGFLAE